MEAEYRRQRGDFLLALQWWLRDVWVQTMAKGQRLAEGQSPMPEKRAWSSRARLLLQTPAVHYPLSTIHSPEALLAFPQLAGTKRVAQRITPQVGHGESAYHRAASAMASHQRPGSPGPGGWAAETSVVRGGIDMGCDGRMGIMETNTWCVSAGGLWIVQASYEFPRPGCAANARRVTPAHLRWPVWCIPWAVPAEVRQPADHREMGHRAHECLGTPAGLPVADRLGVLAAGAGRGGRDGSCALEIRRGVVVGRNAAGLAGLAVPGRHAVG